MGYARKNLICLDETPYYHVISRCVRRAWLWGFDTYTQRDYSHRKQWVLERLARLTSIFAIDVCAYAVMSNHYHLVLHVDRNRARAWSDQQIIERWSQVFRIPLLVKRWIEGEASQIEIEAARQSVSRWRQRLSDVSWFMRCMNEYLARRANAEDECTGRFWEGRFKSQALLDEAGLLTAMAYVDLNPVRAGVAHVPEEAEFTSIYARINEMHTSARKTSKPQRPRLLPFHDQAHPNVPALPLQLHDYLELVDWSGRRIKANSPGAIESSVPPILERLNIDVDVWSLAMRVRGNVFGRAMGKVDRLRLHARALGQWRIRGLTQAQRLFRSA
jgi:REP element-mobilizing transposase RayT